MKVYKRSVISVALFVLVAYLLLMFIGIRDAKKYDSVNSQIDIYGLELNSKEKDALSSLDYKAEFANCVYGYEYALDEIDLNIGFRSDNKRVRRITLRSESGHAFNIKVGMLVEEARKILLENEFLSKNSNFRFKYDDLEFLILSNEGHLVDGIQIEIMDDAYIKKMMK